jgi:hypothetical protein
VPANVSPRPTKLSPEAFKRVTQIIKKEGSILTPPRAKKGTHPRKEQS